MSQFTKEYQNFFLKSEAGKEFIRSVELFVQVNHTKAEDSPELSRDYVQRAKGTRDILNHIDSVTAERGQPKE